ncbi:Uncharacterized protein GBIM_03391 [Gryllus bimaculatus]|nr:Uncharacterized protein GBIM_03391 [Gryllus bimaculatus]
MEDANITDHDRKIGSSNTTKTFICTETGGDGGHGCGGVAATSSPSEFVSQASSCADQILEHLHTLTQEALDHADLTVLTGALGAAALLKNALWCYNEKLKHAGGGSGGDGDGATQGCVRSRPPF